jgi:hypothetical protein
MIAEDFQGEDTSRSGVVTKDPPSSKGIITSLDGHVPISKSRIVGFSPYQFPLPRREVQLL